MGCVLSQGETLLCVHVVKEKCRKKSGLLHIVGLCVEPGWNRVVHSADYARLLRRKPSRRSSRGFPLADNVKSKTKTKVKDLKAVLELFFGG